MTDMEKRVEKINETLAGMADCLKVKYEEISKNNGNKPAYVISSRGSNIFINLYIDNELEEMADSELTETIYKYFQKHKREIDITALDNPEFIYSHVEPRLVSGNNNSYLKDKPTIPFLDMAIIFAINLNEEMQIVINEQFKEIHGLSVEKLLESAKKNIKNKASIISFNQVCKSILGSSEETEEVPFCVLTNAERKYGAQMILDEGALKTAYDRMGAFYLIPSSIHEWILVPMEYADAEELLAVNKDINANTELIDSQDVLVTAIYRYSEKGIEKVL